AATDAVPGADGAPLAGSVAELTRVRVDGQDLSMMIRGRSVDNPVLLFLAGGPGGSELGAMRRHGQALEQDFTVVTFDQRGAGKSYDTLDPTSTLTLDRAVADAVEVTEYLRARFHQDKIYLLGNSWGTILGVLAVRQHPELYRAYIGSGQMVDPRETDQAFYDDTLAWAKRTGNFGVVDTLTSSGPPPYPNVLDYEPVLTTHADEVYPYDHTVNAEGAGGFSENLLVGEYGLLEQLHTLAGFLDVFTVLYPQLQHIDFRVDATRLRVPLYLIQGEYEVRGRAEPVDDWFRMLDAPRKELVVLDSAGHRALFEQPEQFARIMTDTVLADTTPTR
ncbi:MAG: alpha/beta hydrolase, partial [Umezawaea sp.]